MGAHFCFYKFFLKTLGAIAPNAPKLTPPLNYYHHAHFGSNDAILRLIWCVKALNQLVGKINVYLFFLFSVSATFKEYLKRIRLNGISIQQVINGAKLRGLLNAFPVTCMSSSSTIAPIIMPYLVQSKY